MTVGARLPDFDLETSGGGRVTNADLEGRRTVLYFYPKDDTPGCTIEGQEFTQLNDAFADGGRDRLRRLAGHARSSTSGSSRSARWASR